MGFRRDVSEHRQRQIAVSAGAVARRSLAPRVRLLRVPAGQELATLDRIRRDGDDEVRFVEPDHLMRQSAEPVFPGDPSFGLQWGFRNTGQAVNGTTGSRAGPMSTSVPAWGLTTGTRSVVIAEADSGVDYNHPDLGRQHLDQPRWHRRLPCRHTWLQRRQRYLRPDGRRDAVRRPWHPCRRHPRRSRRQRDRRHRGQLEHHDPAREVAQRQRVRLHVAAHNRPRVGAYRPSRPV